MSYATINIEQLVRPHRNGVRLSRSESISITNHKSLRELSSLACNIYLLDTESCVRHSNESNLAMMGIDSNKAALGKSLYDLPIKRECAAAVIANDQKVVQTNTKIVTEEVAFYSNGKINPFLTIKMPWYNETDQIVGIFGCSIMLGTQPLAQSIGSIIEAGLLNQLKSFKPKFDSCFTLREQTIIEYLIRGKTAREISEIIHLSRRTVEHYIVSIKEKMHVKTKSQLIEKAINLLN